MTPEEEQRLLAIANSGSQPATSPHTIPQADQVAQDGGGIINSAGNMATAASQGLLQGTRAFQQGTGLLLNDISDYIGFTDGSASKATRQEMASDQTTTEAAGEALGHPGLSKAGSVVGQVAPQLAVGGAAFQGAKGLLGAGRLADIGANTVAGAVGGALGDAGSSGLSGRLDNAVNGATWGAALGSAFNGFGAIKNKAIGFNIDPKKAEAMRTVGMQGTPSQLAEEATSPRVQKFYQGVEALIAKVPGIGVGLKKKIGQQTGQFQEYGSKVVKELDQVAPSNSPAFNMIKQALDSVGTHDVRQVSQSADFGLQSLNKIIAATVNDKTKTVLTNLKELKPTSFGELHTIRMQLDDQLEAMAGNLANKSISQEFKALKEVRQTISSQLTAIADKNGAGKVWSQANQGYQDALYAKAASKSFYDSYANKAGDLVKGGKVEGVFNANTFTTNWNKMQSDMLELGLKPPPGMAKAIDTVTLVGNTLAKSAKTKGLPGGTLGAVALGGLGATAVYNADIESLAAGTSIMTGLGLMLGTKSGVELLSKSKGLNTPYGRLVLSVAAGLGTAKQTQSEVETKHQQQQAQEAEEQRLLSIVNGAQK